ncbi:MAG: hypothetical protein HOP17_12405, partial [Acidobacteria bacterium]|nr:hypothetical protein [Acidobacteriota bacterium]
MGPLNTRFYEFGAFRVDAAEHIVLRDGQIIPLTPKVFETLLVLVENSGHVVDKDELLQKIWSDTFVEETNLTKNISILRKILNDGDAGKTFIETIPKRGYRFVAEVTKSDHDEEREQRPAKSSDSNVKGLPAALPKSRKTDSGTHVIVNLADWRKLEEHTEPKPEPLPAAVNDADAEQLRVDAFQSTAETSGIYAQWYKRWPVIAAIALFLIATVAGAMYWFRPGVAAGQPQIRSLAVLPLKSLDPNDNALGFGIADAVIKRISQTGEMTVRPASSVRHYLTEDTDAITAAKQLTVEAVLDGTIQRAGDSLRISVNLLKADGTSLWTDSFDTKMTDVFAVQDTISQQVASRLKVRLDTAQQARLTKRTTSNPTAYEYFTRGVYSYDQRGFGKDAKSQNDATIELLKKAVETEPLYGLAHAKLGEAYTWQCAFIDTDQQEKWCELAKAEIRQAGLLDSQLAETRLAAVWLLFSGYGGYQIEAAAKEVLKAQEIDPSIGHGELADIYIHLGLEDLFKREFERALEIDPTSEYTKREFMISYVLLNRWDDYLEIKQKYFPNELILPEYYLAKGDIAKSAPLIEKRVDRLLFDLYKTDGKALL